MADSFFQGFGRFSRPDIGLASDSFANLAEIFESDRGEALRNIRINPETLDTIYGLYADIPNREDLRSASGLNRLLLPSLNQLSEVFLDRIRDELFINKEFYNPEFPLGGTGSFQIKSENVILYNGSLQCESASYRENTLGTSIFGPAQKQTVQMSTSRASLFNIELDTTNIGYYQSAKYASSIRVRRRSHVNRILIPKSNFLSKASLVEAPTHSLTLNIDNGNTGTTTPVKLLATKNTPIKIYCRMATGSIKFTFTTPTLQNDRYFYGLQIQPAKQRPNSAPVDFLPVTTEIPPAGRTEFTVNINITSTGYQNLYDLYLYLYVNPSNIKGIEFSGINIKEFPDNKDIGLIGFNNLETFKMSGGSMTILPLWLKTLSTKLRTLDLADSGDTWRNGPMGWFDVRNASATVANITGVTYSISGKSIPRVPLYTAVSYLTIPKTGVFLNENANNWGDLLFEKYLKNQARASGSEYRQFTALETLKLGDRFYGRSPRFDDVFPGLKVLDWSNFIQNRRYRFIFNNLPKIKNNGKIISYNIYGSGASGSILDVGTSTTLSDSGYISKYRMGFFNIGGTYDQKHSISGFINNPGDGSDWSEWLNNTASIDIAHTNVTINLQSGEWSQLQTLEANFSGGAVFTQTSEPLRTPLLKKLNLYGSSTSGKIPKLGETTNTAALESIMFGECEAISAVIESGISYLLPEGFAMPRPDGNEHKLKYFSADYLNKSYQFRKNDFSNLHNLESLDMQESSLTGRLPLIPSKLLPASNTKEIKIQIQRSNFYDLTSLSILPSNEYFARDIRSINAYGMNLIGCGALLPDFEGSSTGIQYIDISDSLPSTYRSDWSVNSLRNSCILESHSPTVISGLSLLTLTPTSSTETSDVVYKLTGGSGMKQKVQVNDSIRSSETGSDLATVLSVSDTEVIISNFISFSGNLYFARKTVDISGWFKTGFSNLTQFRANNCRLSGQFNIVSGFNMVVNTSYSAVDLGNNLISSYGSGTLTKIFRGNNRKITVDLSNNILSISDIRKIISEVNTLNRTTRFSGCLIKLSGNKLSSDTKYSNYTQQDIFPVTIINGPDTVTALSRNEQFTVYEEITTVNSSGNEQQIYSQVSTVNLNVPGQFISGSYYKTKRDKTQVAVEDTLASSFKNFRKILIDLGFIYQQPSTTPVIVSTTYENETNRNESITDSGLQSLTSCPGPIGSGTCWENNSGQILKLIT